MTDTLEGVERERSAVDDETVITYEEFLARRASRASRSTQQLERPRRDTEFTDRQCTLMLSEGGLTGDDLWAPRRPTGVMDFLGEKAGAIIDRLRGRGLVLHDDDETVAEIHAGQVAEGYEDEDGLDAFKEFWRRREVSEMAQALKNAFGSLYMIGRKHHDPETRRLASELYDLLYDEGDGTWSPHRYDRIRIWLDEDEQKLERENDG
jgi:hypothetical protein